MEFLIDLLGRFHPLIVHLPIGFLFLGLMMMFYDRKENKHRKVIRFAFFWGTFSTLGAALTGTVLYLREGYAWENVQGHLILGILTFVFSFLLYLQLKEFTPFKKLSPKFLGYGLVFVLTITGHLGGNLTHGKHHLTDPLPPELKSALGMEVVSINFVLSPETHQELPLYSGVIQPILDQKCVSCHNPKKTKGELLMHNYKGIMDGGEEGPIILALNAENSEILKRIHLPRDEKKHMPPKAKTQLTTAEIKIIEQWVTLGAPEKTTVAELGLSSQLFTSFFPKDETGIYPDIAPKPLGNNFIDSLKATGLQVAPIYKTSSLLKVSAINTSAFDDHDAMVLLQAKDHIVDLDLGQTQITNAVFEVLQELNNLTVLKLDYTQVTGKGIQKLKSLSHLKEINLVMSALSKSGVEDLFSFPTLEKVYLFGLLDTIEIAEVPDTLQTVFEWGNYQLNDISD